jgi:ectoine hydroxylase-related dioxygenase (phytanoyl-CoA dioxygenase family)
MHLPLAGSGSDCAKLSRVTLRRAGSSCPAGCGSNLGYPLHQDFIAWPDFPESFTTAVLAIDPASAQSGCIEVFPRAHARGYLSERDGNFHMLELDELPAKEKVALELAPGDVAIYGAFMPHRSDPNRSAESRRHLLVSYNARREGGEQRQAHYEAFHHYLRSVYGAMGLGDLYFT